MCTAITFFSKDFYFGRTLDHEQTYGEEVVISPRNHPLPFRQLPTLEQHYAMIGMAHVAEGYPLFYDAANEKGVCMAGLNFPGYAHYEKSSDQKKNVTSFEFIPWVLGQCSSIREVQELLQGLQLTEIPFSRKYPVTPLHWMIADRTQCLVVEPLESGLQIYDNPVGVLTNNPPFDDQMFQLCNYMHLSPRPPHNHFSQSLHLEPYSRGMGAIGLPGDSSSQSRFARAAFNKLNSICSEQESLSQFFHILDSVNQVQGGCQLDNGDCVITQYTSCCNASQGIYYSTTYGNRRIAAVDMKLELLDGNELSHVPLIHGEDVRIINGNEAPASMNGCAHPVKKHRSDGGY